MSIQDILASLTNVQQNAQENVPATLNNGNPNGVNNNPATGQLPPIGGGAGSGSYYYPWLAPTPHMDAIQQFLQDYMNHVPQQSGQPQVPNNVPPMAIVPQGNLVNQINPILANQAKTPPVLPQGSGGFSGGSGGGGANYNTGTQGQIVLPGQALPTMPYRDVSV